MQENSWVCGDNTHGQLGVDPLGPTLAVTKPVQGPQRWSSLTFGQSHTVGITAEGKVFTWGSNLFGQLGRGSNKVSWSNVPEEVQLYSSLLDLFGYGRGITSIRCSCRGTSALEIVKRITG